MKKRKFEYLVCKPCWELKYCPYGPMVEHYPLVGETINSAEVESRYREILEQFASGQFKTEAEILEAIDVLEFCWPPRWRELEQYDYSELKCNVFDHICPVFFNAEPATETKTGRRWNQSRYIPREIMLKVVRRDGQICQICHQNVPDNEIEFDHIIPYSKGGPTSVDNLRVVCADCNSKKSDSVSEILDDPVSEMLERLRNSSDSS